MHMMKKLISRLTLSLMAATLLLSVPAQGAATHALMNAQDNSKDAKAKTELFEKFRANSTGDLNKQKSAYEAGKEYLQKYPSETDPNNKQIKEWIALYESELRGVDVLNKVYKDSKYTEALQLGKPILAVDPNNIKVLTALGYAGLYTAAAGATDNTEPIGYAKKAVQLIEAGGAPTDWKPFKSKDETLGWLNYALGLMTARTAPAEAIGYFTKAAMFEGAPKNDPSVYYYLAALHEQEYQDMSDNYAKTYAGKAETNDSRAAMEKILSKMDLIVDAYARAIAYMDATPENTKRFEGQRAGWMEKLTTYYKFRNNKSDAGLKEMISGIRTKPLPGQPAPATSVPLTPQTP
jgi:hypothetical protein